MIKVSLVPTEYVMDVWPVLEPMFRKSVATGGDRSTTTFLLQDIMSGALSLWIALDNLDIIGGCAVRIIRYPTGVRALSYEELAGDRFGEWMMEGHRVLSSYGKDHHCTLLEFKGRKGWGRFLSELGYSERAVMFERKIED